MRRISDELGNSSGQEGLGEGGRERGNLMRKWVFSGVLATGKLPLRLTSLESGTGSGKAL